MFARADQGSLVPTGVGELSGTTLESERSAARIPQYSARQVLLVWAAAAIPMGLLGWVVAPALADHPQQPGYERVAILAAGLAWQCLLVLLLIYREAGDLRWSTLRRRLWLTSPRDPRTG